MISSRTAEDTYRSYLGNEWVGKGGGGDYAKVSLADIYSRLENADERHTPHLEEFALMGPSHVQIWRG